MRFGRHRGQGQSWGKGKGCGWGRIVERERKRENDRPHRMVVGADGAGRGWRTPGQCVEGTSHGEG